MSPKYWTDPDLKKATPEELLERARQREQARDQGRYDCHCQKPVKLRKYGGLWLCALCQQPFRGAA